MKEQRNATIYVNTGHYLFSIAFKQDCMSSSCCSCHILCCMVQPNQTPPSTGVGQIYFVGFVRWSLSLWFCFISVKKSIK